MAAKTNKQAERYRAEVLRLKRTKNPATGLPYTYAEIAAKMNVTAMQPHRWIPKPLRDRCCPTCLRELEVEKPRQSKPIENPMTERLAKDYG